MFNTHLIIDDKGEIVSKYEKLHLFNLDIPGTRLMESEFSEAGRNLVAPVKTPIGRIGQGICYDIRFPELAISLAKAGADILTYPSSFTVPTGLAHWETLLRCRAIENQCYVVAAGQVGIHNPKRSSFGHSMVIDPWGAIIAQCGDGEGLAVALINDEFQAKARSRLPIWTDRRSELYGDIVPSDGKTGSSSELEDREFYNFGKVSLDPRQVFYRSRWCFAFVNNHPLRAGHSLVSPLRSSAHRLGDLTPAEASDFMISIQKVQAALETEVGVTSSLVAIQDGPDAGQSVDQLHAHIVPSPPGKHSDTIYEQLRKSETDESRLRSMDDMAAEAIRMRKYFERSVSS